ncbi:MAG: Histidine-tRNA ligase [Candidatus Wolfebacteria bacterium GW2011_GWE1_48_7]|nr:MAG: Histidine-tRNA ligase [Candidatus Wolfebacteria bacterium GW2011_GWE1_48_7]
MAEKEAAPKKEKKEREKKMAYQTVKGMHDILPEEQPLWDKVRLATKHVGEFYNFQRIDTPVLEGADIFERGLGTKTDIVEKEMFVIKTRGGDKLVMRPEFTSAVMRAYYQHGLSQFGQPMKLYYEGPVFRYEQPQAGRYRQFNQVGFEILGAESDPVYDAQAIMSAFRIIEELKIKNVTVHINSIGCHKCRATYIKKLEAHYKKNALKICKDCKNRISTNPLRVLDCKEEKCQLVKAEAPIILDYLDSECKAHFTKVLEYLDEVKIPYYIDSYLVRGLDYYNRTVFEFFGEGFSVALGGGGRYDYLSETLKLGKLSAVGSALGTERIIEVMKASGKIIVPRGAARVFLVHIGDEAKKRGLALIEEFRKSGVRINESFGKDSLKSQMRVADKEQAQLSLILGQREVFEGSIIVRDMETGAQESVPLERIVEEVKKRLK